MTGPNVRCSKTYSFAVALFVKAMTQDDWCLWDSIPFCRYTFDVSEVPGTIRRIDDFVFQMMVATRSFRM